MRIPARLGLLLTWLLAVSFGRAYSSTAFTYQGSLRDSTGPASGVYDFRFIVYAAATGGEGLTPGVTNTLSVTNGLFTAVLDAGTNVFTGDPRWLEIGVRTNAGGGDFVTLAPRQKLTAIPYALYADSAAAAASVSASNLLGIIPDSLLSSNVALLNLNASFAGTISAGTFQGSGAGLTNVPLSSVVVNLGISGTNVSVNAGLGSHFRLTCTTNVIIQNPSGGVDGQRVTFEILQDSAGGWAAAWDTKFAFGVDLSAADVVLSTNANKRDFIGCIYNAGADRWFVTSFLRGY